MKIDMHVHSMYSHDSRMKPEEAINRGIELGLDGICFTEHHSYLNSGLIEGIDSKNIKVFRGAEIATDIGHILVYGVEDDSWNFWEGIEGSFMEAQKVIDAVNGIGGVCILAHPFRKDPNVDSISKLNGLVALEVFNGKNSEEEIEKTKELYKKMGLNFIGGSDAHRKEFIGNCYTVFENNIGSMEKLVKELKEGYYYGRIC